MPFKVGQKKTAGRKKGGKNFQTKALEEILAGKKFEPAERLLYLYEQALQAWKDGKGKGPMSDNNHKYLEIALKAVDGLMPYIYPKRKPVDKSGDAGETLTDILKAISSSK